MEVRLGRRRRTWKLEGEGEVLEGRKTGDYQPSVTKIE
jgi:hypothetical protein